MFRGCLAYGQHLLLHELDMIIAANQGRQLRPTFDGPTWGSGCMTGPCEKGASQELIETVNVFAGDKLDPVVAPPCAACAILDVPSKRCVARAPAVWFLCDVSVHIEQHLLVRQLPVENDIPHVGQEPCVVAAEDCESVQLASAPHVLNEDPKRLSCVGGLSRVGRPFECIEDSQARAERLRQHAVVHGRVVHRKYIHRVAVLRERLNDHAHMVLPDTFLDDCPLGLRGGVDVGAAPAERLAPQNQGDPARERARCGRRRGGVDVAAPDAQGPASRRAKTQCNEGSVHCCQGA
mmetsp:Transcript_61360/g.190172  ORF Transcript_61360/g.190172 Transcript_61360/m.190172 type:complete len:293 (-) Transcript_61360:196-1074(-)